MQEIHHQVKIIHLCNIGYRAIIGKELDDKEHQHEIAHIIDFIIFPFLPQQIQEYGIIGDKGENASTRSQLHIIVVKVCVLTKLLIGKEIQIILISAAVFHNPYPYQTKGSWQIGPIQDHGVQFSPVLKHLSRLLQ